MASRAAAVHLVKAISGEVQFELATHRRTMQEARRENKRTKQAGLESHTAAVIAQLPAAQARAAKRAGEHKNGQCGG